MIIIHRITPFLASLVAGFGFVAMLTLPFPLVWATLTLIVFATLLARLLKWKTRSMNFWALFGTPFFFLASSYGFLLLLELRIQQITLAMLVCTLLFFFIEHVFYYTHLASNYQTYAIEHMSSVLHLLTIFFIGALGFGTRLLLQVPLWALIIAFFSAAFLVLYGTLWVSKVEQDRAIPYAFAGAILMTEVFAVITYLPTGFYTNAALLVLFLYLFLGLSRAHFMNRLSQSVVRRYVGISSLLLVIIAGTAQWV